MTADSESFLPRGPQRLLVNDEGKSTLHYFDLAASEQNWAYQGAGRDLQLIGKQCVLRSQPSGFVELDMAARGAVVRDVKIANVPGGIESARRLANGNTIVAGNGGGGIFVWEVDGGAQPLSGRQQLFSGIDKVRMIRPTAEGSYLFCSETNGKRIIHELDWDRGVTTLFEIPDDVPADSMVKAVRVSANLVVVSTGYAASLLLIDIAQKKVLQTIGGKSQPEPRGGLRPLSPFFFSGYQILANGDYLISNWQGHSAERNGQGYQLLQYNRRGEIVWFFDQAKFSVTSSLNNAIALDGLDTGLLHDEPQGVLVPLK